MAKKRSGVSVAVTGIPKSEKGRLQKRLLAAIKEELQKADVTGQTSQQ